MNENLNKYYNLIVDDLNKTFNRNTVNWNFDDASKLLLKTKTSVKDYLNDWYGSVIKNLFEDKDIVIDMLNDWFYENYKDGNFPRFGERIKLISMDDPYGIEPGTTGVINSYPVTVFNEDQVDVKWDNGRSLAIIIGIDKFERI